MLLAESCALPLALLERVLREADEWPGDPNEPLNLVMFADAVHQVDWKGFDGIDPDTPAARRKPAERLLAALAPVLGTP